MTSKTQRNNIKPMFFGIAKIMMISVCLFFTCAFLCISLWHFARTNSIPHRLMSLKLIGILFSISFPLSMGILYAFFGFGISIISFFAFWCLFIFMIIFSLVFIYFWPVLFSVFTTTLTGVFSAFWRLCITLCSFVMTFFTTVIQAIRRGFVFIVFIKRFNSFAMRTTFSYDLLSHNQLLKSWFRLEPLAGTTLAFGSLYYNFAKRYFNHKFERRVQIIGNCMTYTLSIAT